MIIEHTIVDSHIIAKAQSKYYKEKSADEIFRHMFACCKPTRLRYHSTLSTILFYFILRLYKAVVL